jgi:hypothetical protein
MPSPALVQALDRLDQALTQTETALVARAAKTAAESSTKDELVRYAIAELDALIASLGGETNG